MRKMFSKNKSMEVFVVRIILLALASSFVLCNCQFPLQDYCVAVDNTNGVFVNGRLCKDPRTVTPNDFSLSGLNIRGNTFNRLGFSVKAVDVNTLPGVNTLGISLARFDFAPGGQNPPHLHPRASEIIMVFEGQLLVGFVSSDQYNNTLFSKILNPGDIFVFPMGLIHFQANVGRSNAVAFAGLGSQNAGLVTIAKAIFGSNPSIAAEILARALQMDPNLVKILQARFGFDGVR